MAYKHTGNKDYLDLAEKLADVFINNLEDDFIPCWDFHFKGNKSEPQDASAACIAASALLDLSGYRPQYRKIAEDILESLWDNYTCKDEPSYEGIIKHCVGHKTAGYEVDVTLIYADYYFAESISRVLNMNF